MQYINQINQMEERTKRAKRATWVGFFANTILTFFKLIAGIVGKSTAMVADGVHSLSDFITDLMVLVFIDISGKEKDEDHRYGHGKFETFATLLISLTLLLISLGIFWAGLTKLYQVYKGVPLEEPKLIALYAALVSLVIKEITFRYTNHVGKAINSDALIANAWHHRSDALSSVATALGISGAIYLGESWRILDPLAGMLVSIFIFKIAIELLLPSMHELMERSLSEEIEEEILEIINSHPNIIDSHNLKTRQIGQIYAIDIHIELDNDISFVKSHDIATDVEVALREKYGERTITNIHTEPYRRGKECAE